MLWFTLLLFRSDFDEVCYVLLNSTAITGFIGSLFCSFFSFKGLVAIVGFCHEPEEVSGADGDLLGVELVDHILQNEGPSGMFMLAFSQEMLYFTHPLEGPRSPVGVSTSPPLRSRLAVFPQTKSDVAYAPLSAAYSNRSLMVIVEFILTSCSIINNQRFFCQFLE